MYFVYILYSEFGDVYYKGFTENINIRLQYHLEGKSTYTSKYKDWVLVFSKSFPTKKEALIEEKRIKKLNRKALLKLINEEV